MIDANVDSGAITFLLLVASHFTIRPVVGSGVTMNVAHGCQHPRRHAALRR